MSAKNEVHTPLNARIIKVFLSCHGNKISMTASTTDTDVVPGDICSKIKVCMPSTANL